VEVRVRASRGGNTIIDHSTDQRHTQHASVKVDRRPRIVCAVGEVMVPGRDSR
jgi:hypothetical protein